MAIYHLSAKVVSRGKGQSVVAAAAYRAGQVLTDEATGTMHDYTRKAGVEHREIQAPEGAPSWAMDRAQLWNRVELIEKRKDAQLAREIEVGLPIELNAKDQVRLLREFVRREFVAKGMVADFAIHRDHGHNPHAHILLTTRKISSKGFGPKERAWNDRAQLLAWRAAWAEVTNEHLAEAGLAVRIDHRTLKAQGISLAPGRKIGLGLERQQQQGLPRFLEERIAQQKQIAKENGKLILKHPEVSLKALTHGQATFTARDIARYLHTRTEGAEQFEAARLKVMASAELVALGKDDHGQARYSTREMLGLERSLLSNSLRLALRTAHTVDPRRQKAVFTQHPLSAEQQSAVMHLTEMGDLKAVVGVAGSGKSRMLSAAREIWEAEGYTVKGAALSGIAAENLQAASGIGSRTLASYEYAWQMGRDLLNKRDVLVIDEAGMVGTRQLARILDIAQKAHAKVVLAGDPEQLQAIEAGAPFRGIVGQVGMAELHEVRRQRHVAERQATAQLASGRTADALKAYENRGALIEVGDRGSARSALLARWARDARAAPEELRLMLAYTREDVRQLNAAARALRSQNKELGKEERISTTNGTRVIAENERIYFLRNERSLGVRNGTLGTVEALKRGVLQVRLDGSDTRIAVDTGSYADIEYGYAATVHRSQGSTVDRSYVLATPHFDRHTTYVALSRHRESATVYYASEDFGGAPNPEQRESSARVQLIQQLSRLRPKELAHDYLDREVSSTSSPAHVTEPTLDERQQHAAQKWLQKRQSYGTSHDSAASHLSLRPGLARPGLRKGGADEDIEVS
jgi:Ti-type conjugative transfer relaxase TraA